MEALLRDSVGKSGCGTMALLLILTLAVTVVTFPLRPVWAQAEVELYHEDFEDGRAQGWRLEEAGDGEVDFAGDAVASAARGQCQPGPRQWGSFGFLNRKSCLLSRTPPRTGALSLPLDHRKH